MQTGLVIFLGEASAVRERLLIFASTLNVPPLRWRLFGSLRPSSFRPVLAAASLRRFSICPSITHSVLVGAAFTLRKKHLRKREGRGLGEGC